MSPSPRNIIIVEDQGMFRDFLRSKCQALFPTAEITVFETGTSVLKAKQESLPDLVLLDVNLPDMDGVEVGKILIERHASARVLLVSAECTEALVLRMRGSSFAGFVDKNESADALTFAIVEALCGRVYYSASVRAQQSGIRRTANAWVKILSDTELRILPLFGANIEIPQIAAQMGITESTVLWHRKNILSKLELKDDADLMQFCTAKGFVQFGCGQMRPVRILSENGAQ